MIAWAQAIYDGDDDEQSRECRAGWMAREDGMISLVTLVASVFFLVLITFVAHSAKITSTKMEVQNGADSLAYSAALITARGMNGVTAANHLVGELSALVVLNWALGEDFEGQPSEQSDDSERQQLDTSLKIAFNVADALKDGMFKPDESVNDEVNELPDCGATVYRSCARLKQVLIWTYQALAIGELFWKFRNVPYVGPIFAAIGGTICTACLIFEKKIWLERKILSALETIGRSLHNSLISGLIRPIMLPGLKAYLVNIRGRAYAAALRQTVDDLKSANLLEESVLAPRQTGSSHLWVEPEDPVSDPDELQRAQLMRAMYPWVNHWRQPVLEAMRDWLLLARSAHYFRHYTDFYSYEKVAELHSEDIVAYVMRDARLEAKGTEDWTTNSRLADQYFGIMGYALRDAPGRWASNIYRQENNDGVMAYAQAMIYNANEQVASQGMSSSQARVGWDTLNWNSDVPEIESKNEIGDYYAGNWDRWGPQDVARPKVPEPKIRLNWQAKLVPVSKLDAGGTPTTGRIGKIQRRLEKSSSQFRTH